MPQLRAQDLALFEELPGSAEGTLSLTLQDPTPGTIACRLGVLSEPLVRKYFYLNGMPRHLSAVGAVSSVGWSGTPDTWVHGRVVHGGVSRVPRHLDPWWTGGVEQLFPDAWLLWGQWGMWGGAGTPRHLDPWGQ